MPHGLQKRKQHSHEKGTPGERQIQWISSALIVDDFGVKYTGKEHADHLIKTLREHYVVVDNWEGEKYCGIDLDWDYIKQQVHTSMPGYVDKALIRVYYELQKIFDQLHKYIVPVYGAKV